MKRLFTLCLLVPNLFFGLLFTEQVGAYSLWAQDLELYPKLQSYITPSPQAAAITRYGDYPVNYNTGLVEMKIPIYNVQSGSLNLPIDISFHASGRMANETNGVLGMRWVLNAGGVITRTVHGYPDEWNSLTAYTVNPNQTPSYDELRRSCTEGFLAFPNYDKTDSEFDIFNYVLPSGKSGKFVLKNENGVKKAVQIPYEALKIELFQDSSYYGYYGAIKITDVDGTVYYYGNATVYNSKYCEFNQDNYSLPGSIPTGWYLKRMESADKKDAIEFDYQSVSVRTVEARETITTADRIRDYSVYDVFDSCDYYGPYLINEYLFQLPRELQYGSNSVMTVPALSSIKFRDGELNFSYTGQSIIDHTALQHIVLSGAVNKKFKFNQELNPTENELRYLNNLEILSVSGGVEKVEEKYSFDYYKLSSGNQTLPSTSSAYHKDWWGYSDGNAVDLLPYRSVDFYRNDGSNFHTVYRDIGGNADRDPDLESMKLGMIKSITYPTGGKTEFEYENNYYEEQTLYGTSIKDGPGLRIKKVTNKPIIGTEMIKNYKYGADGHKTGYINPVLKPGQHTVQESSMMVYYDFINAMDMPAVEKIGYRIRTYSSEPLISPGDFGGNTVWYNMVTEYSEEGTYGYGSEYYNAGTIGKIIYEYSPKYFETKQFVITDNAYYVDYPKVFADSNNLCQGGKLLSKTTYKKENGLFIPTLKESFNYYDSSFEEVWDMPTYRHVNFSVDRSEHSNDVNSFRYYAEKDYHDYTCSVYGYGFRKYVSRSEKLADKTIEHFDGAGISTTTNYFYDPHYDQLKKEETTSSDGNQIRLEYEYPFDNNSLAVNNKMVDLNMIATPLIKSQYVGGIFTQSKKTDYFEPDTDVIRPLKEYYKKNGNTEEPIILYNNYDSKGNPTELQMAGGTTIAYVWGYKQTLPVAKVENATQLQILALNLNMTLLNDSTTSDGAMQAELQKIRTGLPNAMVTTYTYKPLIGISTITDPKGDIITYSYDSFGRLQNVKDKNGNLLSENEYHYEN